MRARFRTHAHRATLAGTTFCDACGQVCTPACRQEARRDLHFQSAYRHGLIRF